MMADRLRVLLGALVRSAARQPFLRDRSGTVWIYVAVSAATMLGMVGLALDVGRFWNLNTEAQDAADAAALAAASQLNGNAGAIARATNAAMTNPLVTNAQAFSSAGHGTVTIASTTFYSALPADDSLPMTSGTTTTDDTKARFVQVTTQQLPHANWFLPAVGASANASMNATAVAGNTQVACKISPLVVCNPEESNANLGAGFTLSMWQGKQLLLKAAQSGAQWQPGNFGLLDTATGSQSVQDIAHELAAGASGQCTSNVPNTKPGQSQGMREALNTEFDMWQNPFFGSTPAKNNSAWAPAVDVTKGMSVNAQCNSWTPLPPTQAMPIPRDSCFNAGTCNNSNRFGDGTWNCQNYWMVNHPGKAPPPGCTTTASLAASPPLSRWAMYQFEICPASGATTFGVPTPPTVACPPNDVQNNTAAGGENQNPTCAAADTTEGANRRIINFAVVDCLANSFQGHTPIAVTAFVRGFLTEPVSNPPDPNIYLEIADKLEPGQSNGLLRDIVQLYR
jgi:Flp pilus assembly protein TadG